MCPWKPTSGDKSQLWAKPESVIEDTWAALQLLEEDRSLHNIVDVSDHVSHGHDLSRIVKRSLISSSFVVLKMPQIIYREVGGDASLAGYTSGWDISAEQRQLESLITSQGLHKNDFCIVLPSAMQMSSEAEGGDDLEVGIWRQQDINDQINRLESHIYNLQVGANYATVRRLLKQDESTEGLKTGILMPDISNLSLEEITKLRKDYDNGFSRLRYSLKKYLDGIAEVDQESKFAGVIEEIDYECRKAEDEFQTIKRKHSRSLGSMLITSSLVGVAAIGNFFVPNLLASVTAAVGSVTLTDIVKSRVSVMDDTDDLKKSDYWVAWKVHQENLRKSRSKKKR